MNELRFGGGTDSAVRSAAEDGVVRAGCVEQSNNVITSGGNFRGQLPGVATKYEAHEVQNNIRFVCFVLRG